VSDVPFGYLPDGTPVLMGCLQPEELRFGAVPSFDEANEVLPESQWEEHDDYAAFTPPVRAQKNNNCTAAALSPLAECLFRSVGVENVPTLSWSFLYARNNGNRDQGAYCRDLALDFKGVGIAPATLVPDSQIYTPRGGYPQDVMTAAGEWCALEVFQCLNSSHVASALSRRFLVYHGFVLGNRFFNTGRDGKVPAYDGRYSNGHAMWSRGLTRKFGDWRAVTVNSWGTSFGENGVCYCPSDYFWAQSGRSVNLDAYAFRAVKWKDKLPVATN
jgi:hypothetical protein